jgi:hypothetical protein
MTLHLHDRKEGVTVLLEAEQLDEHKFRLQENHLFDRRLVRGTEIEVNPVDGENYEFLSVCKVSDLITRRFILSTEYSESDYLFLGSELEKYGGFWQLDLDRFLTINIPRDLPFDLDQVMSELNIDLQEDVDHQGLGSLPT